MVAGRGLGGAGLGLLRRGEGGWDRCGLLVRLPLFWEWLRLLRESVMAWDVAWRGSPADDVVGCWLARLGRRLFDGGFVKASGTGRCEGSGASSFVVLLLLTRACFVGSLDWTELASCYNF